MMPDDLDAVFSALAHRDRRRILDLVRNNPGCRVEDLGPHFATSRVAILKHLKVLTKAELIVSEKVGRERLLYFNIMPIQIIYDRWATEFSALWAGPIAQIKYRVEAEAKAKAEAKPRRKRDG
ncbi:MAG: transcriptional regulator [Planctomycetota bacterium]|nr:transcriptional regulator [Planctomycetota bacterium]